MHLGINTFWFPVKVEGMTDERGTSADYGHYLFAQMFNMNVQVSSDTYGRKPDKCSCSSVYLHMCWTIRILSLTYNICGYLCYFFLYNIL